MPELILIEEIESLSEELERMESCGALGSMGEEFYQKIEQLSMQIMNLTNELLKMMEGRKHENRRI